MANSLPAQYTSTTTYSAADGGASKYLHTTLVAEDPTKQVNSYKGYDNVHWYVGNAKQAAAYYVTRMGFTRVAYRGLETGSRTVASHVVRNGDITFVFTSPLHASKSKNLSWSKEDQELLEEIHAHLETHGDAVRDVAFEVNDADAVYNNAIANGAHAVYPPKELSDEFGKVRIARIRTYGDTTHTLIQRNGYNGAFLPGFRVVTDKEPTAKYLPEVCLNVVDHCVGNQDWDEMEAACD
jgi:4-hydroxyphenylpyruvate dioxygenase